MRSRCSTPIAAQEEGFARFRREAEICSRLGHPNIVEVYDFNRTDEGCAYSVMELLEGDDLGAVLNREGVLSLPRTLALLEPIASALQAAHDAGVVHRDLKPRNLFVSQKAGLEVVKILDFGISKIIGSVDLTTATESVIGTPLYMSPEQARGESKQVDARANQFSLASVAYEMLSGRRAFGVSSDTPYTVLYRIVNVEPQPLSDVPPGVWAAIRKGMAKDARGAPRQRSRVLQALLEAADESSDGILAPAPRPPRPPPPAPTVEP